MTGFLVVLLVLGGAGRRIHEGYAGLLDADSMIRATALLSGAADRSIPVTLVSIDDETRAKWGNPVITPHAAVAELIKLARTKGATSILVDIDLSSDNPSRSAADPDLYNEIAHYPADGPILMLVRNIRYRGEQTQAGHQRFVADSVRPTPYDHVVEETGKAVWVNAVTLFENDRVARRVQLWQSVCEGSGGTAYGSPALYVAAAASGDPARPAGIPAFLESRVKSDCGNAEPPPPTWPARNNPTVHVQYMFGAGSDEGSPTMIEAAGKRVPLFRNIAAWTIVSVAGDRIEPVGDIDASPFKDRAALIGVTHADSRDVNATPLGSQPGVLILANSVAGARTLTDMPEMSKMTESIIVASLFVLFAYLAAKLHLLIATLLVGAGSVAALMILSRMSGFDAAQQVLAITILLVVLHRLVDAVAGIIYDWNTGKGWRALLKPKVDVEL
ncbi:hypothetical protein BH10PSE7_BH10PSE7_37240 [soil metagenome]